MRPAKISQQDLMTRCAAVFKGAGYHGTSMGDLAQACGLTKASFYHHYRSKDVLLEQILIHTHESLRVTMFKVAFDDSLTPVDRLQLIGVKTRKLFSSGSIGCLMGVIAIDVAYSLPHLLVPIRLFMEEWALALAHIFIERFSPEEALAKARRAVADYEGAMLMARVSGELGPIDAVTDSAIAHFKQSQGATR
ncbi:TetR/AcrR family transcriptional regulator [Pseudomonas lundensis]|uniref:TetR/AcrR family transcriptional regulator n=1 Tax=Pseudomonas lundensis TaxID=86185 RepID=UPI0014754DE0|nr:TetR/AcrR family transcriptional regulator [Pseudomonas lundensis]NNA01106.1 TetR/AcrR family transcriptional regulator [Pseudomonas lundensis]